MTKYNLPIKIETVKDLIDWLTKEVGIDTEIDQIHFGNDLAIINRSVEGFDDYEIHFWIDNSRRPRPSDF